MHIIRTSLATLGLAAALPSFAVTIGFDTASDFDNNFVKLPPSSASTLGAFTFNTEPVLRKMGAGAQSAIYDTSATGGTGGTGGTSGSAANLFGDVTVSADVNFNTLNGPSLGLFSRVNTTYTSGYLALVTSNTAGDVRLRIFDSNSNPTSTAVGTLLYDQTIVPGAAISASSFYTFSVTTTTTATNTVLLAVDFATTGGTSIASGSFEDITAPLLAAGQVGFRAASATLYIDNFTVAAIPEPSTYAAFLGLAAMSAAFRRRTR